MKELSIEQKAKRYDVALERARCLIQNEEANVPVFYVDNIKDLFPELKESEDERIRKEIIDFIYDKTDTYELREKSNSWLAWLEKQGEHAKFRNKIQIGDKVTRNEDDVLVNLSQLKRISEEDEEKLNLAIECIYYKKPASSIKEDTEVYDNTINWLKSLKNRYT